MFIFTKKIRSKFCFMIILVLLMAVAMPVWPANMNQAAALEALGPLRILEVQPSVAYDITSTMKSALQTYFGRTIELTQMPMPMFISKVDEINGYYDIVYIGNNQNAEVDYKSYNNSGTIVDYTNYFKGTSYRQFGPIVSYRPNYSASVSNDKEFYSGTDITDKTSNKLKNFIDSEQLTIFDSGIFDYSLHTTKLYTNFYSYKQGIANVKTSSTSTLLSCLKSYNASSVKKRPSLDITSAPVQYNGENVIDNNGVLSFAMNIRNTNGSTAPMTVKLFIDKNGDGMYREENEKVSEDTNVSGINGYSINYLIPKSFTGLLPWKIEVTDEFGAKSYQTGFTANKGDELHIRVLQLMPSSGCTLHLSRLSNINGVDMLHKQDEYNIEVTEMLSSAFNNSYKSGATNVKLNGNYDMIIFGFGDCYSGGDLTETGALNAVKAFAQSGQSIMFTHDTIGFNSSDNLTKWFKDMLGLNAFATDSSKPSTITVSTGMTRLALFNPNSTLGRFPDTKKTHKINESNLTRYPYILGDISVSLTHLQYIRLDMEDPNVETAFTYKNDDVIYNHGTGAVRFNEPETLYHDYDGANDYYTFFKGNLTYSGTGHSSINSVDEYKMFINTILKASVGSNHAPVVQIQGLTDDQNIANTQQTLNFSVMASDYEDQSLTGQIFIDKNGDGVYNEAAVETFDSEHPLTSGIARAVSEAKGVSNTVTRFGIKVVVKDPHGAEGSCEIHINNVITPTLSIINNGGNYLVGDQANIDLDVQATASTLNTTYTDLKLNAALDTNAFTNISAAGWSNPTAGNYVKGLSNVVFSPQPNLSSQTGSLGFVCATQGISNINANLTYKDGSNVLQTVNGNFSVNVGVGRAHVILKEQSNGGTLSVLPGKSVVLRRYADAAYTTLLDEYTETTNAAGAANFNNIPTGYYKATIQVPSGYKILGDPTEYTDYSLPISGKLQFSDPNKTVNIVLYQPVRLEIDNVSDVRVWDTIDLDVRIIPSYLASTYPLTNLTWSITSGGEYAVINEYTGVLKAKRTGSGTETEVRVLADTHLTDGNGNPITKEVTIHILKTDIDIN